MSEETPEPVAYILGRLLAILERRNVLPTSAERAYQLAVQYPPQIIVPALNRLNMAGRDAVESLMAEIKEIPLRALVASEQAQFAVGYYHQRAAQGRDVKGVKARREALGLTQQALAEKLSVPVATIRSWEQGARIPRPGALDVLTALEGQ